MSKEKQFTPGLTEKVPRMNVPNGLDRIIATYGDPDIDGDLVPDSLWEKEFLVRRRLPFIMKVAWAPERQVEFVTVNKECADYMLGALELFLEYVGLKSIIANGWDRFAGIYNLRLQTGAKYKLSIHSWAAAIDLNPHLGEFGVFPTQPLELVQAFRNVGANWGGDWPAMNKAWPYDGMHWQFAVGY